MSPRADSGLPPILPLDDARRWARVGVLAALALVLGYVETFIPLPVPVPGVKLGLGNIAVLVALALLDVRSAAAVAVLKVFAAGFLFGNPLMMAYSAGGTALAFAAMALFMRIPGVSIVLVAIAGAILHNVGQLAVASLVLGTPLVWASAPVLVIAACITGALTGVAVRYTLSCLDGSRVFVRSSSCHPEPKAKDLREAADQESVPGRPLRGDPSLTLRMTEVNRFSRRGRATTASAARPQSRCDARVKFVCLLAYMVAALHARSLVALGACALAALALAVAVRLTPRAIAATIRPLIVILVFTVVMQVLYIQQGTVLVQIGSLNVTQGALEAAGAMLVGLVCVMVASVAFMRRTPSDELVATFDWLLGPLRALGVRTGSFMLALTVAFRFVPVFVGEFEQLKRSQTARHARFDGSVRDRVAAYMRLFPPLVRSSFRRADRLAETFVGRCFTGASRTSLHARHLGPRDLALVLATAALAAFAFAL